MNAAGQTPPQGPLEASGRKRRLADSLPWLPDRLTGWQLFQALRYGGMLLLGIAFAHGPLSRVEIGHWESLFLLSGLTGFFWVGGLLGSLVPRFRRALPGENHALLAGSFWSAMVFNAFLVGILALIPASVGQWLGQDSLPAYGLFLLYMLANNPAYLAEYIYLLEERPMALVIYGAVSLSLLLVLVLVPVYTGFGLTGAVAGLALHAALRWCWLVGLLYRRLGHKLWQRPDKSIWQSHLAVGIPLAGSLLLGGASAYVDGLVVVNRLGPDALAVFQYGARELPMVFLVATAFSTAAAADVAADRSSGLALIKRRSGAWLWRFLPIAIGLMLTSRWWYPLVFSPDFSQSHIIFDAYLLLIVPRLLFPQTVLTGMQKTQAQLLVSGFELVLNVGLSLLLIGQFGLLGVAWATVIAHAADKGLLMGWLHWRHGIRPASYVPLSRHALASLLLLAAYLASRWLIQA